MSKSIFKTVILFILITLIGACGSSTPQEPASATTPPVSSAQTSSPPPDTTAPMTAEGLIEECAKAMGGTEKIDALQTMRFAQRFPDHAGLIRYEIKRPNLVRMGDNLVFDGERASWLEGRNPEGELLVAEEEWKDFEVDIAWYVPAFFDYPAEYMGTETLDNIETHKLQVELPLGAIMTYHLDAQTHLVYKATAYITIDGTVRQPERVYSDYQLLDGILYPHAFTYQGRDGVFTAMMVKLEFNVPLEDERFSLPKAAYDELSAKTDSIHFEKSAQAFESVPTYQIGLADLDGDGDLDAVFSNGQSNHSQVWLNDGNGFFTDSGQQLGLYGHGVNVGDLDGDGDLDLLINTHRDSAPSRVYLNDGYAVFHELEDAFDENIGFNVYLFDFEGDGDLDAAGEAADAVYIYLNDGSGAFSPNETTFPVTSIWGDIDSDGDVDVVIKEDDVGYSVHLNDGVGNFTQQWNQSDTEAMIHGDMALGDVDYDSDLDLVITNGHFSFTSHPVMIFLNDGTGQFTDSDQRLSAVAAAGVSLGDLDGDGDLDLVFSDYMNPCQIWVNDGSGQFTDSGFRFGEDKFYRHIHLGDLDGDGDLDIFLAAFGFGDPNEIWFNQGK